MENLVFKYRIRTIVKILILALITVSIILYIVYFIIGEQLDRSDIKYILLLGVYYFVIQSDKSRIGPGDNGLKVKWVNWVMEKNIPDSSIEKIVLGRLHILINRKDKKPVRLILESLEKEDKAKLYAFMIEYSKVKNLVLERNLTV